MNQNIVTLGPATGASRTAIKKWKQRGKVPHEYRLPLLDLATERGLQLARTDFVFKPHKPRKAAKHRRVA